MIKQLRVFTAFVLLTALIGCNKDVVEAFEGFKSPSYFPEPVYHFNTNAITKEKFELGRKLFYETKLSANNQISCGSCHVQTAAFTHHGHTVSHGIFDRLGTRNAPPIMNLAWNNSFMWDGGIVDLDLQSVAPITNHVEMDESMANVLDKLRNDPGYVKLFRKAYSDGEINTANFLKSLSQFMLMCVSNNSKYDSVMKALPGVHFSEQEAKGRKLVKEKCGSCHTEPLFTDNSFRNNGLVPSMINDQGRYMITQAAGDKYKFRVPSLRNLAYTAPYMHDGRFLALDAVLDHYTSSIADIENLDPLLKNGISLTAEERSSVLAFLNTLNDRSFLTDKRFSEQ